MALWVWGEPVYYQLTRGGSFDVGRLLTGRNLIWAETWSFIQEHPWRGNHGYRFEVPWHMGWVHVHNSFLQMAANHGLLATPLVVWTLLHVGRRNWPYVATIVVLAMGQYAIFWNFSFVDLIWVAFLKAAPWPSAAGAADPVVSIGQPVEVRG
jgi:O-antigen ligase